MNAAFTFLTNPAAKQWARLLAIAVRVVPLLGYGLCSAAQSEGAVAHSLMFQASPGSSIASPRPGLKRFPTTLIAQSNESAQRFESGFGSLAVVFPDIGEPYRAVFAQIIEGIQERTRIPVRTYPVRANADMDSFVDILKRNGTRGVVALGRQGVRSAVAAGLDVPIVVGGVLAIPEQEGGTLSGISLTPDPGLLFSHLKNLLPGVRRVVVIYNPEQNDWLIRIAREAARKQGLELVTQEARDLATAVRAYEAAFASSERGRDAVWLPQDATTAEDATILPFVLRESWTRNIPVFSSSLLHAKRGALFALYPNNIELGRALAASAQAAMNGEVRMRGMQPLRNVQIAVNLRTASHLGLHIGYQQQRSFDITFPEP